MEKLSMEWAYISALAVSGVLSLAALLSRKFRENMLQCVGLALFTFATFFRIWSTLNGGDIERLKYIFVWGIALYAIGTARKVRQHA